MAQSFLPRSKPMLLLEIKNHMMGASLSHGIYFSYEYATDK